MSLRLVAKMLNTDWSILVYIFCLHVWHWDQSSAVRSSAVSENSCLWFLLFVLFNLFAEVHGEIYCVCVTLGWKSTPFINFSFIFPVCLQLHLPITCHQLKIIVCVTWCHVWCAFCCNCIWCGCTTKVLYVFGFRGLYCTMLLCTILNCG